MLTCPFCGGEVTIRLTDEEGNLRPDEYEKDPWSGIGFVLYHTFRMAGKVACPISHDPDESLGVHIYPSRKDAEIAWTTRHGEKKGE